MGRGRLKWSVTRGGRHYHSSKSSFYQVSLCLDGFSSCREDPQRFLKSHATSARNIGVQAITLHLESVCRCYCSTSRCSGWPVPGEARSDHQVSEGCHEVKSSWVTLHTLLGSFCCPSGTSEGWLWDARLSQTWYPVFQDSTSDCTYRHQEGRGPASIFGERRVPFVWAGLLSYCPETPAWIHAQGSYYSLSGPGGEPASAAPAGGRSSLGVDVLRTRQAHIYGPHPEYQKHWAALSLPPRTAEGESCLLTEDVPLDSWCHNLGIPFPRWVMPPTGEGSLHPEFSLFLGFGA